MKQGDITITTASSNLVSRKYKKIEERFDKEGISCLRSILEELGTTTSSYISTWKYLDDNDKVRDVTCLNFGLPVQLTVSFYK